VLGQVARDLVVQVPDLPEPGTSTAVTTRLEALGGKGANTAVGIAQLGTPVALVGVVGDDEVGARLLDQARADGIDTTAVVHRAATRTGLIVDLLTERGEWRYLEDLPDAVQLTEADVAAAEDVLTSADTVVVQLQQPSAATLAAARCARAAGRRVVLDGAPRPDEHREPLLAAADVLRLDHHEAELLTGARITDAESGRRAARDLLERGPQLVAVAVDGVGNAFAWPGDDLVLPLTGTHVVDTTGGGDAFTAALTCALTAGRTPWHAARLAVAAAGATVAHPGGRPDLTPGTLRPHLAQLPET
jgi:ribokinase